MRKGLVWVAVAFMISTALPAPGAAQQQGTLVVRALDGPTARPVANSSNVNALRYSSLRFCRNARASLTEGSSYLRIGPARYSIVSTSTSAKLLNATRNLSICLLQLAE